MRSQRQLPHHTPRALPRLPFTPPAQGQNVFSSTVFCLRAERHRLSHSLRGSKHCEHQRLHELCGFSLAAKPGRQEKEK